jgi:hypothetical protein
MHLRIDDQAFGLRGGRPRRGLLRGRQPHADADRAAEKAAT